MLNLRQILLVEQRQLQVPIRGQLLNLRRSQRRNPAQAFLRFQILADACRGEHAAIAHHHDLLQMEALTQFADLRGHGFGIACVAFEHLHGYWAALVIGQQSEDDL
jgi:hypothetical protein